jgi:hypothetical protein
VLPKQIPICLAQKNKTYLRRIAGIKSCNRPQDPKSGASIINQKTGDPFSILFFDNNCIPAGVDVISNN